MKRIEYAYTGLMIILMIVIVGVINYGPRSSQELEYTDTITPEILVTHEEPVKTVYPLIQIFETLEHYQVRAPDGYYLNIYKFEGHKYMNTDNHTPSHIPSCECFGVNK